MRLFSAALIVTSALTLFAPARGVITDCDGTQDPDLITRMNLTFSNVVTNELHLTDGEIRYEGVGKNKNINLDLVITVNTAVEVYPYTNIEMNWDAKNKKESPPKAIPEGFNGKKEGSAFGILNMQTIRKKPKSGEGNFQICLVESGKDNPIKNNFTFTIFDFDERGSDDKSDPDAMLISIKEKVLIDLGSDSTYKLTDNTEIKVACEDPPYVTVNGVCPEGNRTVFLSSEPGIGGDNPDTVYGLTEKQKNRAVALTFVDTDCFNITFDHYCPCEQDEAALAYDTDNQNLKCIEDNNGNPKCKGYSGGNLLFAGDAPEITEIFPCITESPSMSPSLSPSDSTKPPTNPPTADPKYDCDLGPQVFLEHQIGDYDVAGIPYELKDAVKILSQDTTNVTVRLKNVWPCLGDPNECTIDSIFYQYDDTIVNEACGKAENVTQGEEYKDITIQCLHLKKFAKFDVYVVDNSSVLYTNKTIIPTCCNGTDNAINPAVKYTFAVNCECYKYPEQSIS